MLDEGYVSRTLAGFERRGWITRAGDGTDRCARPVILTEAGRALVARLRADSRAQVAVLLPPGEQAGVARALFQAQAMMQGTVGPVDLTPLHPGDAGWVIARHAELYAAEAGFDATFETLVARIVADFLASHDPARERGWIARRGDLRLGSIFCVKEAPGVARLRLFLLEPTARGTGLAQRLLDTCTGFARDAGCNRMRLWTHESHRAAGRLYARNGFAIMATQAVRSFGQDLVEQVWERAL